MICQSYEVAATGSTAAELSRAGWFGLSQHIGILEGQVPLGSLDLLLGSREKDGIYVRGKPVHGKRPLRSRDSTWTTFETRLGSTWAPTLLVVRRDTDSSFDYELYTVVVSSVLPAGPRLNSCSVALSGYFTGINRAVTR